MPTHHKGVLINARISGHDSSSEDGQRTATRCWTTQPKPRKTAATTAMKNTIALASSSDLGRTGPVHPASMTDERLPAQSRRITHRR